MKIGNPTKLTLVHRVRNPLAGIQGAIAVLRHDTVDEPAVQLCDELLDELCA